MNPVQKDWNEFNTTVLTEHEWSDRERCNMEAAFIAGYARALERRLVHSYHDLKLGLDALMTDLKTKIENGE